MAENIIIHEISLAGYKATSTGGMLDLGTWGSYGIEKLHLTLDAAWQDLTITAFFNVNGKVGRNRACFYAAMLAKRHSIQQLQIPN